mmetsp:Transcript_21463/g.46159  ORF Transcript_21463/g.46159 Transcript_21463/m.46159 type:complete len:111 (+) Transcript_21463:293-625(+)
MLAMAAAVTAAMVLVRVRVAADAVEGWRGCCGCVAACGAVVGDLGDGLVGDGLEHSLEDSLTDADPLTDAHSQMPYSLNVDEASSEAKLAVLVDVGIRCARWSINASAAP